MKKRALAALRGWERVFSVGMEQVLPARLPLRFAAAKILFDFRLPIGAHGRAGARGVHKAPYRLEIQLGTAAVGVVVRRAVCLDAKAAGRGDGVDVCAQEQKFPAVLLFLPLHQRA